MMEPIKVESFMGSMPIYDPRLLPATVAAKAVNCRFERGSLEAVKFPTLHSSLSASTTSINFHNGTLIEFSGGDVDYVSSPVSDASDRFYFTDGIKPKKSSVSLWPSTRSVAIQAPVNPITVSGANLSGDTIVASVSYYYTYVTEWGEESAPSPPTAVFDIYDTYDVDLSNMSTGGFSDQAISKKRIYRLTTGTSTAEYQYVDEIPAANSTYRDTKVVTSLGEVCQTEKWVGPPDNMKGIIYMGNGYMAGFNGNTVYISEPFVPYAYPLANQYSTMDPIIGLGHFNQALVILTSGRPVVLNGVDPRSMSQDNIPDYFPCVSKRSIVSAREAVFFASKDGLYMCSSAGVKKLTHVLFREDDWAALQPEKMIGVHYDDKYYCFIEGTSNGFVIDYLPLLQSSNSTDGSDNGRSSLTTIVELDLSQVLSSIKDVTVNSQDGRLYIAGMSGGSLGLFRYDASTSSKLSAKWKSKEFYLGRKDNPGFIHIELDGSCKCAVNSDGLTARTFTESSNQRLSASTKFRHIQFEFSDFDVVRAVFLASNFKDILG